MIEGYSVEFLDDWGPPADADDEMLDWPNPPCTNPSGHRWNEDDYCSDCGADGRA